MTLTWTKTPPDEPRLYLLCVESCEVLLATVELERAYAETRWGKPALMLSFQTIEYCSDECGVKLNDHDWYIHDLPDHHPFEFAGPIVVHEEPPV